VESETASQTWWSLRRTMGVVGHGLYYRPWSEDAHSKAAGTVPTSTRLVMNRVGGGGFLVGS
jgi:hypothetical protein